MLPSALHADPAVLQAEEQPDDRAAARGQDRSSKNRAEQQERRQTRKQPRNWMTEKGAAMAELIANVRYQVRSADVTHGVTAREICRRIASSTELEITKMEVNQVLFKELKPARLVEIVELQQKGGKTINYWKTCEREMTSIDEVERLVMNMNTRLTNGDDHGYASIVNLDPDKTITRLSHESEEHHVQVREAVPFTATSASAEGPVPFRFQCKVALKAHFTDGSCVTLVVAESKPCLQNYISRVYAFHALLLEMSRCKSICEEDRNESRRLYELAYNRGKTLRVGDVYPFEETEYIELKGKKNIDTTTDNQDVYTWDEKSFTNSFSKHAHTTVVAFANTRLYRGRRPVSPCLVVFGVTDNSQRLVHGVSFEIKKAIKPEDYFKQRTITLTESLKQRILSTTDAPSNEAIIRTVQVDISPLALLPHNEQKNIWQALVIVKLVFDDEFDGISSPCFTKLTKLMRDSSSEESEREPWKCYIRTSKPETRALTANDKEYLSVFYPLGLPDVVKKRLMLSRND